MAEPTIGSDRTGDTVTRRAVRFLVLVTLILVVQVVVYRPSAFSQNVQLMSLAQVVAAQPDIIYMGDSVLTYTGNEDPQTAVDELVRAKLSPCETVPLTFRAFHTTVYRAFLEYIADHAVPPPQLVIVPINLRTFSLSWSQDPAWQYEELRMAGYEGRNPLLHFILALHASSELTEAEYEALPVTYQGEPFALIGDFPVLNDERVPAAERLRYRADQMKMDYLYTLDPADERVQDLIRLAEISRTQDIPLLLYYTPIDVEEGVRLHGPVFRQHVQQTIDTLDSLLAEQGVQTLNLAFDLPHENFSYWVFANEHLALAGRTALSERVTTQVAQDQVDCMAP